MNNTFLRSINVLSVFFIILMFLSGCSTIPVTGRKQLNLIPSSQLIALSNNQFKEIIEKAEISTDQKNIRLLNEVGSRIARSAEKFMSLNTKNVNFSGYSWEFKLIEDDSIINAFCLSGGKVCVYSGMLKVSRTESGLATVIAHEIAHSILNHHGERMSHLLLVQLGGITLNQALKDKSEKTKQLSQLAYGLGTNVGFVLPYSRAQEYEADRVGLILMSMAGYAPSTALDFWERMKKAGQLIPIEFLSTHPAPANRIEEIRSLIPEAEKYYFETDPQSFSITDR